MEGRRKLKIIFSLTVMYTCQLSYRRNSSAWFSSSKWIYSGLVVFIRFVLWPWSTGKYVRSKPSAPEWIRAQSRFPQQHSTSPGETQEMMSTTTMPGSFKAFINKTDTTIYLKVLIAKIWKLVEMRRQLGEIECRFTSRDWFCRAML